MSITLQETDTAALDGLIAAGTGVAVNPAGAAFTATSGGTPGSTTHNVNNNLTSGEQVYLGFESASGEPGFSSWQAGTYTVSLDVTTGANNMTWSRLYVVRLNSSGVAQATVGSITGQSVSLSTTGTKTLSVSGSSQTAGATDRLYFVLVFNCSTASKRILGFKCDLTITTPLSAGFILEEEGLTYAVVTWW